MAFLWVVRTIRNVYEVANAALTFDCCAVDKRQQNKRDKPAHSLVYLVFKPVKDFVKHILDVFHIVAVVLLGNVDQG